MHHAEHENSPKRVYSGAKSVQNFQLTDLAIRRLSIPERGVAYYWDGTQPGLGLRVGAGGAKTFVVLIGSGRRKAIGRYPLLPLGEARALAKRMLAEITLGRVHPTHTAFDDVVEAFLEHATFENRARTVSDYRRLLTKHFSFKRSSIADIKPRDVLARLKPLAATPSEKHHAFTAGRAFFRWAVRNQYLDRSPMENLETPSNGSPRERVLSLEELARVYKVAAEYPYPFGPLLQLLVLLGQRRGETAAIRWDWVGTKTIYFPKDITKNGRDHAIPLPPLADAILMGLPRIGDYVFPATRSHVRGRPTFTYNGFTKDVPAVRLRAGIDHFTLHDLRRSVATQLAEIGVSQVVVEKLLNHVSGGAQSPIAQVYNRYSYMKEMDEALVAFHGKLATALNA